MPRNQGIYTLPPVYQAQPGTTIRAVQHNVPFEDVAAALTNSLPRDGSAPMTGNLPMGGRRVTGLGPATDASDAARFDQLPATSGWLTAVAGLTIGAGQFPVGTGGSGAEVATISAWGRTLIAATSEVAGRDVLGFRLNPGVQTLINTAVAHSRAVWLAGTATEPGMPTPVQVKDSAALLDVGVDQVWSQPSRAANTIYTNSTGKPIQVNVTAWHFSLQVSTNGTTWVTVGGNEYNGNPRENTVTAIVPPTHRYRIVNNGAAPANITWAELR